MASSESTSGAVEADSQNTTTGPVIVVSVTDSTSQSAAAAQPSETGGGTSIYSAAGASATSLVSADESFASSATTVTTDSPLLRTTTGGIAYTYNLTTTFSPPTSCRDSQFTVSPGGSDVLDYSTDYDAGSYVPVITAGLDSNCYPPNFYPTATPPPNSNATSVAPFYFPGLIPEGYASQLVYIPGNTTYATCCPSSWRLQGYPATSASCVGQALASATIYSGTHTTTMSIASRIASPIVIAWASSTNAAMSGESSTVESSGKSGLSTGAKNGIGVGVAIGALSVFIGGFLFYRGRRKGRKLDASEGEVETKPDLEGGGETTARLHEAAGDRQIHEANDDARRAELDHQNGLPAELGGERAELDGGWTGWEVPDSAPGKKSAVDHNGQGYLDDVAKQ